MSRWWRAYDEALHDPKLIALPDRLFRAWFNLLCIASKHCGVLPAMTVVAIELRVSLHKAAEWVTALVVAGLMDELEPGKFAPHNWDERQFKSDVTDPTAADRMRNYRNRKRNDTVTVTPPRVQSTEAETERGSLRSLPRKRGEPIPADWVPSERNRADARAKGLSEIRIDTEGERFRDHSLAKGVLHKNVDAAWRNWVTSPLTRGHANGSAPRPGSKEDQRERTAEAYRALSDYVDAHVDDARGGGETGETDVGLLPLSQPPRS